MKNVNIFLSLLQSGFASDVTAFWGQQKLTHLPKCLHTVFRIPTDLGQCLEFYQNIQLTLIAEEFILIFYSHLKKTKLNAVDVKAKIIRINIFVCLLVLSYKIGMMYKLGIGKEKHAKSIVLDSGGKELYLVCGREYNLFCNHLFGQMLCSQ